MKKEEEKKRNKKQGMKKNDNLSIEINRTELKKYNKNNKIRSKKGILILKRHSYINGFSFWNIPKRLNSFLHIPKDIYLSIIMQTKPPNEIKLFFILYGSLFFSFFFFLFSFHCS